MCVRRALTARVCGAEHTHTLRNSSTHAECADHKPGRLIKFTCYRYVTDRATSFSRASDARQSRSFEARRELCAFALQTRNLKRGARNRQPYSHSFFPARALAPLNRCKNTPTSCNRVERHGRSGRHAPRARGAADQAVCIRMELDWRADSGLLVERRGAERAASHTISCSRDGAAKHRHRATHTHGYTGVDARGGRRPGAALDHQGRVRVW